MPNDIATDAPAAPFALPARLLAEAAGTFLLVFALVGAAVFTAVFPEDGGTIGIGLLGVATALGVAVMIGAAAFGPISGGHFNPAVTVGLAVAGRTGWRDVAPYVLAQIVGGSAGAGVIALIAHQGPAGFAHHAVLGGFASNGYGVHSPGGFGLLAVALVETVATGLFVTVILRVTAPGASTAVAPVLIGATLTVLLLVAIPISNASLNPARSIATALVAGPSWLADVWAFLVFPTLGAVLAGLVGRVRARRG